MSTPAATISRAAQLENALRNIIRGKDEVVRLAVVAIFARGHLLIEGVPGVGKTTLAQALARGLDCTFQRVQFTSDMLPSDVLGISIYSAMEQKFEFRHGPVFTNVLLADEINRTTPRTQSALLEAMSEGQVSIEGRTYPLAQPFLVIATQNPFESEGTYPLPENQLDRFMLCTEIGYPERAIELQVLASRRNGEAVDSLKSVVTGEELRRLQTHTRQVRVDPSINEYVLDIVSVTRKHPELQLGVSTRGAIVLSRAAQAMAMVENRDYVVPDDVKRLAIPVLAHRVAC